MCDMPQCHHCYKRKARKDHQCYECCGVIQKGEEYYYHSGIWDEPASFKICADCEQLREDMDRFSSEGGYCNLDEQTPFGGVAEAASEAHGEFTLRFIAIMRKRCKEVHPSWLDSDHDLKQQRKENETND